MRSERPLIGSQRPLMGSEKLLMVFERPHLESEKLQIGSERPLMASERPMMRCKEPKGIESEQGSGSEGDAVLYNTWLFRNVNTFFEKFSGGGA